MIRSCGNPSSHVLRGNPACGSTEGEVTRRRHCRLKGLSAPYVFIRPHASGVQVFPGNVTPLPRRGRERRAHSAPVRFEFRGFESRSSLGGCRFLHEVAVRRAANGATSEPVPSSSLLASTCHLPFRLSVLDVPGCLGCRRFPKNGHSPDPARRLDCPSPAAAQFLRGGATRIERPLPLRSPFGPADRTCMTAHHRRHIRRTFTKPPRRM
jgi:hypothetical protein